MVLKGVAAYCKGGKHGVRRRSAMEERAQRMRQDYYKCRDNGRWVSGATLVSGEFKLKVHD